MAGEAILIVEDEGVVALDVSVKLEDMGYRVCGHAISGQEAIQETRRTRPDLVLMDIKLKGTMDGIEAVEHIQAQFDIPVVYLTAYADKLTVARAKKTGPLGYVLKPFEIRELRAAIEMALHRHKLERRVKESERWLAATLRSIGDGVIATDAEGQVVFMNPVAEDLTGWDSDEASGRALSEVFKIAGEDTPARLGEFDAGLPAEEVVSDSGHDVVLVGKGGRKTFIEKNVAPIRDDTGDVAGIVLVFRDITERKEMEDTLRQYSRELETRNRELDAFARTVAHELKNPLGRVIGFANLLTRDSPGMTKGQALQCLRLIAKNGKTMDEIIDQLLLLAQARKAEVPIEPVELDGIVAKARKRLAHMISQNDAKIVEPIEWPTVLGHAPWLEEVFVNYISNAIKYGGDPPVIRLGATVQADQKVRLWVRDNGRGIPREAQDKLFTPFTQLDQSASDGYGLGLSIVRLIVEKLDGGVGVESELGQGSTFSFTLPGPATMLSPFETRVPFNEACPV
jgi:PAS domain S-box-containing protein